jgi:hypothetical protein
MSEIDTDSWVRAPVGFAVAAAGGSALDVAGMSEMVTASAPGVDPPSATLA